MPPKPKKMTLAQALKKIKAEEPCKSKPKGKLCKNKLAKAVKDHKQGVKRVVAKKTKPTTELKQSINIKIGDDKDKKPTKRRKRRPNTAGPVANRDNRSTQGVAPPVTNIITNVDAGLPDQTPNIGQYGDRPAPPIPIRRGYEDGVGYADEVARRGQARQEEQRARRPAGRLDARNVAEEFNRAGPRARAEVEADDRRRRPSSRRVSFAEEEEEEESKGGQEYFDDAILRRQQRERGAERHRAGLGLGGGLMGVGDIQQQTGVSTGAGSAYPGTSAQFPILGSRVPPQDAPLGNPSGGRNTTFRTGQALNGMRTGGDPAGSGGGAGLLSDGYASSTNLGSQPIGHSRLAHAPHASQPQPLPQPRRRGRPAGARTRPVEVRRAEQEQAQARRQQRAERGQSRLSRLGGAIKRAVGLGGSSSSAVVPYNASQHSFGGVRGDPIYQDASLGGGGAEARASGNGSLGPVANPVSPRRPPAESRIISRPSGRQIV